MAYNAYIVVLGATILAFSLMGTSCESRHLNGYILNMDNENYPTLKGYEDPQLKLNFDLSECEQCRGRGFLDFMTKMGTMYPLSDSNKEELHQEGKTVESSDCPECETKSESSQIYTSKKLIRKRTASCMKRCLTVGYLHPSQCHSLC